MKATLTIELAFDENRTDAESLANAMDRLIETALSIPDVLEEYGPVKMGLFYVHNPKATSAKKRKAGPARQKRR
jgi:hypothetical protein